MENILVPCDFSKPAEEAFRFAVEIAKHSKGQIHVLYVIDITFLKGNRTLSHAYAFNVNFLKDIEKEAEQKFQIMCGRYAPATMTVKFRHVVSSLMSEIENAIASNGIDLVVMGTHGEGNAAFGSNTEKVVRNVDVPVFSVKTSPRKVKDIVVPILLPSHLDERFVKEVRKLQAFFDARLHILYINTPLFFKDDNDSYKEVEDFAKKTFPNYSIHVRSDYDAEAGIAHFAAEIDADMIAMGTHAWKGLTHFFVGSTAEDIVNHIKIPIWTICLR